MSDSVKFLSSSFPEIDSDTIEYLITIAEDTSLDDGEKVEIITEHLEGASGETVCEFLRLHMKHMLESKQKLDAIKEQAVAACLSVMREQHEHTSAPETFESKQEVAFKKELLKRYDPDHVPITKQSVSVSAGKSKRSTEAPILVQPDDDEILAEMYGLGANENKLRKAREREEMRERAKQEQEDARALKVQQKLKQQGSQIKSTNSRKK
jgi:hypothetical protein